MKKNTVKALAALFLASFAFLVTACKTEVADTMPPAKVTDVNATAANGKAVITWTNPADEDFYATRITVAPKVENGNSSLVIEGATNEKSSASFEGLVNGTEYTFKLCSMDKSHNDSEAVEVKATTKDTSDKTAPADVSDLTVNAANGNAVLTWRNPTDLDFNGVKITMSPAAGTLASSVMLEKDVTSFSVSGLTNGIEYTFKIQTFDTSLNYSEGAQNKATPQDTSDKTETPVNSEDSTAPAEVTALKISCVNGTNGKVNAVLTWKDPADADLFGMEVTYAEKTNSKSAFAAMSTGSLFVAPGNGGVVITDFTAGKTYIFTVKTMDTNGNKRGGTTSDSITMTLTQSDILEIILTPSTEESTNQDVTVSVKTNSSSVSKIYWISGIKENYASVASSGTDITSSASFTVTENGTYTVAVMDYDGRRESYSISICNIDKTGPVLTNSAAKYDYDEKTITVTWNTSDSDVDYYLLSYKKGDTSVVADEKVTEKSYTVTGVDVGDTEEKYTFTVKAFDKLGNPGKEESTSVTPQKVTYEAGDIILKSGKIKKADSYSKDDTDPAVAVVVGFNSAGNVLGIGVDSSQNDGYYWATENTTGCKTNFTEIAATVTGDKTAGYEFTGNTDGSNNWTEICKADDTASANAKANYPAFYYANNYGTSRGYTDDLESGWYIPSIAELYKIYKNMTAINNGLEKVTSSFKISSDSMSWYWSSSQSTVSAGTALSMCFSNGEVIQNYAKANRYKVLLIRAF